MMLSVSSSGYGNVIGRSVLVNLIIINVLLLQIGVKSYRRPEWLILINGDEFGSSPVTERVQCAIPVQCKRELERIQTCW